MEEIIFYDSWLPLDKKHFRILAMLADKGNFQGSLAQMCRNLSITSGQQKTNNALKESIEYLSKGVRIVDDSYALFLFLDSLSFAFGQLCEGRTLFMVLDNVIIEDVAVVASHL